MIRLMTPQQKKRVVTKHLLRRSENDLKIQKTKLRYQNLKNAKSRERVKTRSTVGT